MRRAGRAGSARENGVATVTAAIVVAVLLAGAVLVAHQVSLVGLRQQAGQAADLAALAGSSASVEGRDGCKVARRVAKENGAELSACRMDADVATVTARVTSTPWWVGRWSTSQKARAAPVTYLE